MSIYENVKNTDLPKKQEVLINSILKNIESSALMSGHELCEVYNTSFSTLTRISKALGYEGFPELKKNILNEFKNMNSLSNRTDEFFNSKENDFLNSLQSDISSLNTLGEEIDQGLLKEVTQRIFESKRVLIVGVGQLRYVAGKLADSLKFLGKKVEILDDIGFSKKITHLRPNENDHVIAFSMNSELVEMKEMFLHLSNLKVSNTYICDKKISEISRVADSHFYIDSKRNGFFTSTTPYLVITNIIEDMIFSIDKYTSLQKIRRLEDLWNDSELYLD